MKNTIGHIKLESDISPKVMEVSNKDWVEYGNEEWRNLYPQFLIDLYYGSSTHASIINATAEMVAGQSIEVTDTEDLNNLVKVKQFFANVNSNETMHDVVKKISFDYKLQGAYCLNIVYNRNKTAISEVFHVPVERVRSGKPNVMGRVEEYFVSADWTDLRNNEPVSVPAFNMHDRTSPSQLLYVKSYSPNLDLYGTPDYSAGCNWALIDSKIAEFHLSNISNGFSSGHFISFANGIPTTQERNQIENNLKKKFAGSQNAGKMILSFSDDKTRTPEITPLTNSNNHEQFIALQELMVQNVLTAHRVTSPMLFGIKSDNGFGSNANELNDAFEIYLNTVVKPMQENILRTISKVLSVNGMELPLEFVQSKPVSSRFDMATLKEVMTTDEIREELGLEPLGLEETAEDEDTTQVAMSSDKCDCNDKKDICDCKVNFSSQLDDFLTNNGESMEGYQIIHEDDSMDEGEDFDFETELNKNHLELASSGVARPNSKSEQDGTSKQNDNTYRVRYRYVGNTNPEREFCQKMMKANKLFRKEDIIKMGSMVVNAGWGLEGADTYSIWKYKGGGACKHKWNRVILVTENGEKPKRSDLVITTTAARSQGFKTTPNEQEVPVAPTDMVNKGFVNK
jgi:hypothetical protein